MELSPVLREPLTSNRLPLINSSVSLEVQDREESNPNVVGVHHPKNIELDLTLSGCADNESDGTIQIPLSTTSSYSNCNG